MTALTVGVIGIGAFGSRVALRLLWNGHHTLQLYDASDVSTRQFTNDYGGMTTGSLRLRDARDQWLLMGAISPPHTLP